MIFEEKRVVFETTSQNAPRKRGMNYRVLSRAVRFRAISYEDVEQALKRAPQTTKKERAKYSR